MYNVKINLALKGYEIAHKYFKKPNEKIYFLKNKNTTNVNDATIKFS
jgi:hypothetical protein